jgi:hypothetical protein
MMSRVSCCLSATGISLLGRPVPAGEFHFPHGRPTWRLVTPGPRRGSHVPHEGDTAGEGAPYTPGLRCSPAHGTSLDRARRFSAASPALRSCIPSAGFEVTRHQQGFTHVRPSSLPLHLWTPDGTRPLGLNHLSFAPRRYQQRTSGWGQALNTSLELHTRHRRTSQLCAHSSRATSCRTVRPRCAPGAPP